MAIMMSMIMSYLAGAAFDDVRDGNNGTTNHWFAASTSRQFVEPAKFVAETQGVRERVQRIPPRRLRARPGPGQPGKRRTRATT